MGPANPTISVVERRVTLATSVGKREVTIKYTGLPLHLLDASMSDQQSPYEVVLQYHEKGGDYVIDLREAGALIFEGKTGRLLYYSGSAKGIIVGEEQVDRSTDLEDLLESLL